MICMLHFTTHILGTTDGHRIPSSSLAMLSKYSLHTYLGLYLAFPYIVHMSGRIDMVYDKYLVDSER